MFIDKYNIKSKFPIARNYSVYKTRVLLEQIRSEVKVIAEHHGDIMKKLGEHDTKFERMEQRFDRLEMVVMQSSIQIKELKAGQENLKIDVQTLQSGQKRIEQKIDTALDNHEKRIGKLEEKVNI